MPESLKKPISLTTIELADCSLEDLSSHSELLQSAVWGRFKSEFGWQVRCFTGSYTPVHRPDQAPTGKFQLLILTKPLLKSLLRCAYVPFGPVFEESHPLQTPGTLPSAQTFLQTWNTPFQSIAEELEFRSTLARKLLGALPLNCFFIRFDIPSLWKLEPSRHSAEDPETVYFPNSAAASKTRSDCLPARLADLRPSSGRIQVPDTVILELRQTEPELLSQMHKKHRYNIRLAEKKGLVIQRVPWQGTEQAAQSPGAGLRCWYSLYQETAKRDRIGIHSFQYYQKLFKLFDRIPETEGALSLLIASDPREPQRALAGIIVCHYGRVSTYLYGASSAHKRELMPNYLLHWHAIREARERGSVYYDFYGIPPHPKHPEMQGLYRFKTGFGGRHITRLGAWDYPYSKFLYTLFSIAETARIFWHHRFKKAFPWR